MAGHSSRTVRTISALKELTVKSETQNAYAHPNFGQANGTDENTMKSDGGKFL